MLPFTDKVTIATWSLALFVWNVAPAVCTAATSRTGGLAFGLSTTLGVIYISDIIHSLDHDKW